MAFCGSTRFPAEQVLFVDNQKLSASALVKLDKLSHFEARLFAARLASMALAKMVIIGLSLGFMRSSIIERPKEYRAACEHVSG